MDLSRTYSIEFFLIFPRRAAAEAALQSILQTYPGADISIRQTSASWEVLAIIAMVPSHGAISDMERFLEDIALANGGAPDGWGVMQDA